MLRYNNYHKHTHESNMRGMDSAAKPLEYILRAKELGHTTYSTVEHEWAGKYLQSYDLCTQHGLKMLYGAELYAVADRTQKDRSNFHLVAVARNQSGFAQLTKIMAEANRTGFYHRARVDLELLLSLNPNDFILTSACIAGVLRPEGQDIFLNPLAEHFGKNLYLEVQSHSHPAQVQHNHNMVLLASQYGLGLIHANDSHYIHPAHAKDRALLLKGKGRSYGDEDSFVLDYPDYNTIVDRYEAQSLLLPKQVHTALENTLVFDDCEPLHFDKEIKMPTLYPGQDPNALLKQKLAQRWQREKQHIPPERHKEYMQGIAYEYGIVQQTGMADYFLLNEAVVQLATTKYGGTLSRTGRGSAVSFYINKLLGFTEIDRFDAEVPLYPTRFMSAARILQSRSLPDIDLNWADISAPLAATKELLGEDGVYYMYALGTMQEQAAFRNVCRAHGLPMEEYNEVAKNLDDYRDTPQWKPLVEQAQKYIGVIDSISPSPCSFLLSNQPISQQVGFVRVGDTLCASIDGATSDSWKFLKNDYLQVRVWRIIANACQTIGIPIPSVRQLRTLLTADAWRLYHTGLTATLNQADTENSTGLLRRYRPKNAGELSGFVAAIRPGFASLLQIFLERQPYSTGVGEIDDLLAPSYHFLLYQESIMAFLVWCGQPEENTYDTLKKIAKKKFTPAEQQALKAQLLQGYTQNTGTAQGFDAVWQVVEDAAHYSFNASHSLCVAWDSLYGAYLKVTYPLEYFSTVLNEYTDDTEKTSRIVAELPAFGITLQDIRYGKSRSSYSFDTATKTIYKSVASIKFCNACIAEQLYSLSKTHHNTFPALLSAIRQHTSTDSRQRHILTALGYFRQYGLNGKLQQILELHELLYGRKQIRKGDIQAMGLTEALLQAHSAKQTEKLYKDIDVEGLIEAVAAGYPDKPLPIRAQILLEKQHLEYIRHTNPALPGNLYFVDELRTFKDKAKPYLTLYALKDGTTLKTKITDARLFAENPFHKHSFIKATSFAERYKRKRIGGQWQRTNETEQIITGWELIPA